ncbi:hypothetical protein EDB89DRAFT_1908593 [Lactarius sanguifluus]|nr:hypothetical protein EDB89DRAFT_1908593 [Lactarius sanguifluus]
MSWVTVAVTGKARRILLSFPASLKSIQMMARREGTLIAVCVNVIQGDLFSADALRMSSNLSDSEELGHRACRYFMIREETRSSTMCEGSENRDRADRQTSWETTRAFLNRWYSHRTSEYGIGHIKGHIGKEVPGRIARMNVIGSRELAWERMRRRICSSRESDESPTMGTIGRKAKSSFHVEPSECSRRETDHSANTLRLIGSRAKKAEAMAVVSMFFHHNQEWGCQWVLVRPLRPAQLKTQS